MAISVGTPGGGLDVSTDSYLASLGSGGGGTGSFASSLLSMISPLIQQSMTRRNMQNEAMGDALTRSEHPMAPDYNAKGDAAAASAYDLMGDRSRALLAQQQAEPSPTKLVTGPQIIPGQVGDPTKLMLGNLPAKASVSGLSSPGAAGGSVINPNGLPTGSADDDDIASMQKKLQLAALGSSLDKTSNPNGGASPYAGMGT
jgi:hypothetical protein